MRLALDTQLYIEALRGSTGFEALHDLYARATGPMCLSEVVAQELMAGARDRESGPVETSLLERFIQKGRVLTPSFRAWRRSGEAIAALHRRNRIDRASITKFANDILIAASCAEEDVVLITRNTRDFTLIAEEIPFQFVEPWP